MSLERRYMIHAATPGAWEAARVGEEYHPASLAREGYVHASWPEQVPLTLARHFAGAGSLVAIALDAEAVADRLVCEDTTGHGEFPHIHGPIPRAAILAVHRLDPRADGVYGLPDDWLTANADGR